MKRKIVRIDEEKCNGCGLCVNACHEGALELVEGKARLVSESYCDGLGACLPECPTGAIVIEEREAAPFDEEAMARRTRESQDQNCTCGHASEPLACGCPGTHVRTLGQGAETAHMHAPLEVYHQAPVKSQLRQWPVQIKLVPVNAPYFDNAHLLVAADCTAYAYANVHSDFMRNRVTLIGCPKLDDTDYVEKLTAILRAHNIKSITVLRMEVPCCGGLVSTVKRALIASGKMIPWGATTISTEGTILEE